jgi:hypothetical protein
VELRYEKIHGKQRPSLILLIPLGINSGKTTVVAVGARSKTFASFCIVDKYNKTLYFLVAFIFS